MRRISLIMAVAFAVGAAGTADAKPPHPRLPEVREIDPALRQGKPLPIGAGAGAAALSRRSIRAAQPGETPAVGTVRTWLGYDDVAGGLYYKDYTLRAVGAHIEVWVANDLRFPGTDCRNDSVAVTDDQARYLATEFDTTMYPRESEAFSVPPARDGANARLAELPGEDGAPVPAPAGYWGGAGDRIVTLVDNVRDDNFYDTDGRANLTYIAGFFLSALNELFDRNVMTIDAYDWLHRTGANPPNEPAPGDTCKSRPARPLLYEGTFAHEYQHLLESYEDPDEASWVNEGLSDWAQTLVGYVDPRKPITDQDFDSHVQSFLGWYGVRTPANPNPRPSGPENSLTLWGDQGPGEILADYGAAYTMMEMLHGRYGTPFMTALHRGDGNGFAGLAAALDAAGVSETPRSVVRDWLATAALDGVLDRGARLDGRARGRLRTPTLDASVNWDAPDAYSTPGAPPNGADFVRLRDAAGAYLHARDLDALTFEGAPSLEPDPVEWTVDVDPDGAPGDPALFSGAGNLLDRSIVRSAAVPAADPTLTFQSRWDTEAGWDFGFVQVSTDGGRTWRSLANADTTAEHEPEAIELVQRNVPGFTGDSAGWRAETFDLSAYAGQTVLVGFRYVTDPAVVEPGWWIDDVAVGGSPVSDGSTLDGWRSLTQVAPVPVAGYTVQLVGYTSRTLEQPGGPRRWGRGVAFAHELRLTGGRAVSLDRTAIRRLLDRDGRRADVVAALVTQDDPTELVAKYARYALTANGVAQPGG